MGKVIGVLSEFLFFGIDCELNLSNQAFVVLDIDQDIIGLGS